MADGLPLRLHREMLRIRLAELALAREYKGQQMKTPTHFAVGQEASAVGVCNALAKDDVVFSHHRAHHHYLARGGSLRALAAELYGREGGCSKGRGGSVHLTARDVGFIASTAILGQCIALAAGAALAFKLDKAKRVAVAFFGEGAGDEGVTWETFNYASLHKLPVLFVCENNIYATETRQPETIDLCRRAAAFGLAVERVDGNDVMAVHEAATRLIARARDGGGPAFLECMTYRWLEHVGPNFDHVSGRTYRTEEELREWAKKDPIEISARGLMDTVLLYKLQEMVEPIEREVEAEIAAARESPFPTELMHV